LDHAGLHGGRRDDEDRGQWKERQSRRQRRKAELLLQEVSKKQKYAKDPRARQQERRVCAAPGTVPDDVQGSKGCSARRSIMTNAVRSSGLATSATIVAVALQPCISALENP
jgi:hypothetical protein